VHVGLWHFAIKLRRLAIQVSPSSVLVPGVLYIDTSVLWPFGVAFIACLRLLSGFTIPFQSAWWTYPESLLFVVDFLRKQWTLKSTCKGELDISWGLRSLVWILNQYQHFTS
jgi:hypothetical protein